LSPLQKQVPLPQTLCSSARFPARALHPHTSELAKLSLFPGKLSFRALRPFLLLFALFKTRGSSWG